MSSNTHKEAILKQGTAIVPCLKISGVYNTKHILTVWVVRPVFIPVLSASFRMLAERRLLPVEVFVDRDRFPVSMY